ncbi:MAG: hypothetical protein ACI3VA_09010 [Candidatus Limivicinus sp.]
MEKEAARTASFFAFLHFGILPELILFFNKTIYFLAVRIAPTFVAFLANSCPLFAAESASADTILPR